MTSNNSSSFDTSRQKKKKKDILKRTQAPRKHEKRAGWVEKIDKTK